MCHRTQAVFRCGHSGYEGRIIYCENAGSNGKRQVMCTTQRHTTRVQKDQVCGANSCRLSVLGGQWRCCTCAKKGNQYGHCEGRACAHNVCQNCTKDPCKYWEPWLVARRKETYPVLSLRSNLMPTETNGCTHPRLVIRLFQPQKGGRSGIELTICRRRDVAFTFDSSLL